MDDIDRTQETKGRSLGFLNLSALCKSHKEKGFKKPRERPLFPGGSGERRQVALEAVDGAF